MPAHSTIKITAKQYRFLEEDPSGIRLDLVDGEIEVSCPPTFEHAVAATIHVDAQKLGLTFAHIDVVLDAYNVRRPDILFVRHDRRHLLTEEVVEIPPDLCVEVISPSSVATDRERKFRQYEDAGIAYYWIVYPSRRNVEAFALQNKKYVLAGKGEGEQKVRLAPFPEWEIPLGQLGWRGGDSTDSGA